MRSEKVYIALLGVLIFAFILAKALQPRPIDWTESFSSTDKIPYGTYLLFETLPPAFPDTEIQVNTAPVFESDTTGREFHNWIFIDKSFGLDQWETEILLQQVKKGAHVFIAARNFQQKLADTLQINTELGNPLLRGQSLLDDDTTYVTFTNPGLQRPGGWPYRQSTTEAHFIRVDTSRTVILGKNAGGKPNFIKTGFGNGAFFLHSNPSLFTNFYVKQPTGYEYSLNALSYLPDQPLIWDEYYKASSGMKGTALIYVVSQQSLKRAWFLLIFSAFLFLIFKGRRKQRQIPEINPPKNTGVEFARTIGSLYLEKGNHKLLAEKKVQYFLDYIRNHIGLETNQIDRDFKEHLSQRTGIAPEEIHALFDLIDLIREKDDLDKNELQLLTERIDRFYNNSQR